MCTCVTSPTFPSTIVPPPRTHARARTCHTQQHALTSTWRNGWMATASSAKHELCARVQQRMRHVCSETCLQHEACFHWPREGGRGDGESVRAHAGSGRKGASDRAKGRQCEYSGAGLRGAGPREGANFRVCPKTSACPQRNSDDRISRPTTGTRATPLKEKRKNLSDIENLDVERGQNFRDVRY